MTRTRIALWVIVVVAAIGVVLLALDHETYASNSHLGEDAFKLTYQFLLLVVLGGAVGHLYKTYDGEREEKRAERDRRRSELKSREESWSSLTADLIDTYNGTKRIRRLLRARALKCDFVSQGDSDDAREGVQKLDVATYDGLIQELIEHQLSFERHKRLAKADLHLSKAVPDIIDNLGTIEKYLNAIIQEYEENLPGFRNEEVNYEQLKCLAEYIGPYKEAKRFQAEFKEPFIDTLTSLQRAINRTWDKEQVNGTA